MIHCIKKALLRITSGDIKKKVTYVLSSTGEAYNWIVLINVPANAGPHILLRKDVVRESFRSQENVANCIIECMVPTIRLICFKNTKIFTHESRNYKTIFNIMHRSNLVRPKRRGLYTRISGYFHYTAVITFSLKKRWYTHTLNPKLKKLTRIC